MRKCLASSSDLSYGWRSSAIKRLECEIFQAFVVVKKAAGMLAVFGCVSGFRFTLGLCDVTSG